MIRRSLPWLFASFLFAQEVPPPSPEVPELRVEVPTFQNPTCPIMGKKVSMPLFVDTELGRFYVCCKPCYRKVLRDLPAAHKTAYPVVEAHANTVCPVSGEPIGEDAVEVTLQGHRFKVCCAGCVADARTHSQVTLVRLTRPTTVDTGNTTCPVSGKAVSANAFVLVGDALVHLATAALAEDVAKAPAAMLAKAQQIAAAQPKKPPHVHRKEPPTEGKPTDGKPAEGGK